MPFNIDVTADQGVCRIRVGGELDLAARPIIQSAVSGQLDDVTVHRVVVDLADLRFLDSTGIGVLVLCKHLAAEVGKEVHVVDAAGQVAEVLELTGVAEFLAH